VPEEVPAGLLAVLEARTWRDRIANRQVADVMAALWAQARAKGGFTPFMADLDAVAGTVKLPVPAVAAALELAIRAGMIDIEDPPPGEAGDLRVHLLEVPPMDPILAADISKHHADENGLNHQ